MFPERPGWGGRLAFLGGLSAAARWDNSYIGEPANAPERWAQLPSCPAAHCLWPRRAPCSCLQAVQLALMTWRSLRPRGSLSRAHLPCAGPGMEKRAILIRDGLDGSPTRNLVSLPSQHHAPQASLSTWLSASFLSHSQEGSCDPTGGPSAAQRREGAIACGWCVQSFSPLDEQTASG